MCCCCSCSTAALVFLQRASEHIPKLSPIVHHVTAHLRTHAAPDSASYLRSSTTCHHWHNWHIQGK